MAENRFVTIDVDVFTLSLELLIGESDPLQVEDLFDDAGLTKAGLSKMVSYTKELLENIHADKIGN